MQNGNPSGTEATSNQWLICPNPKCQLFNQKSELQGRYCCACGTELVPAPAESSESSIVGSLLVCTNCREKNDPEDSFCSACGYRFCPSCHTANLRDNELCSACSTPLNEQPSINEPAPLASLDYTNTKPAKNNSKLFLILALILFLSLGAVVYSLTIAPNKMIKLSFTKNTPTDILIRVKDDKGNEIDKIEVKKPESDNGEQPINKEVEISVPATCQPTITISSLPNPNDYAPIEIGPDKLAPNEAGKVPEQSIPALIAQHTSLVVKATGDKKIEDLQLTVSAWKDNKLSLLTAKEKKPREGEFIFDVTNLDRVYINTKHKDYLPENRQEDIKPFELIHRADIALIPNKIPVTLKIEGSQVKTAKLTAKVNSEVFSFAPGSVEQKIMVPLEKKAVITVSSSLHLTKKETKNYPRTTKSDEILCKLTLAPRLSVKTKPYASISIKEKKNKAAERYVGTADANGKLTITEKFLTIKKKYTITASLAGYYSKSSSLTAKPGTATLAISLSPVPVSQPSYHQPSYDQPSYHQPSYDQPSYYQPAPPARSYRRSRGIPAEYDDGSDFVRRYQQ